MTPFSVTNVNVGRGRPRYCLLAGIMLCLWSALIFYGFNLVEPPIRADGFGYYAYLPSLFIHNDISMQWLNATPPAAVGFESVSVAPWEEWTGIKKYELTGKNLDRYPIGVATLQLPFFLIGKKYAELQGFNVNGFSRPFQIAVIFSGIFYFIVGLVFVFKFLRGYFSADIALKAVAAHFFGMALFFYASYEGSAVPSHIYGFCFIALLLWSTKALADKPVVSGIVGGFLLGILCMIRNIDVLYGIFFVLFGIGSIADMKSALTSRTWWLRMSMGACVFLLTIVPQLYYWKYITGNWLVYSYKGEGFNWLTPEIFNVLFSARKGLFVYFPVLIISVLGFFKARKHLPQIFWPMSIFLVIFLYLTASWNCWWYGESLGMRPFIEAGPLFCAGFCSFYAAAKQGMSRSAINIVNILVVFFCAWTGFYVILYAINAMPYDNMTLQIHADLWKNFYALFLLILCTLMLFFKDVFRVRMGGCRSISEKKG